MENLNLPPFYPGQKVVSLVASSIYKLKKGDIVTVLYCEKCRCSCDSGWVVFIKEFVGKNGSYFCKTCKLKATESETHAYGYSDNFAPLEEKFEHISLSKVIEIETCLVSEN